VIQVIEMWFERWQSPDNGAEKNKIKIDILLLKNGICFLSFLFSIGTTQPSLDYRKDREAPQAYT